MSGEAGIRTSSPRRRSGVGVGGRDDGETDPGEPERDACPWCAGSGEIRSRHRAVACPACKGEGRRR